jgi:hypothetical protein
MKFQPGNEYGKQGRPKGARNKVAGYVYSVVYDFLSSPTTFAPSESEPTKLETLLLITWRDSPRDCLRFVASILPKELSIETNTVNELTDEELDRMIEMLRERALAAREEQAPDDASQLKIVHHGTH